MAVTPMMQQYLEIKDRYRDYILFYRLGDFYEMFFEDAQIASKELDLTLTGRDCGEEERAPMCGVPYHSCEPYIGKLISRGYKVAICEQTEDPSKTKTLVKREVIRVITPGTLIESDLLSEDRNNYLCTMYCDGPTVGLCFSDISTAYICATAVDASGSDDAVVNELSTFAPREIVTNVTLKSRPAVASVVKDRLGALVTERSTAHFDEEECLIRTSERFGNEALVGIPRAALVAAGAALKYIEQTQMKDISYLKHLSSYDSSEYLEMDVSTRRNLELTETMLTKDKKGSLLWVLDKTSTSPGARLLKFMVEHPLTRPAAITKRQQAVTELFSNLMLREELRAEMENVLDLERLITRVTYGTAGGRDLRAICSTASVVPRVRKLLADVSGGELSVIRGELDELEDVRALIDEAIVDQPPFTVRDGGMIREGYNAEVDELRSIMNGGRDFIKNAETREREKTGIKNLKIGYNRVFGYYIEVPRSASESVPEGYIRKQTLSDKERYITDELKEMESTVLGAEERLKNLEYELFTAVRDKVGEAEDRIRTTASALARLDVFIALSEVAAQNGYVCPTVDGGDVIDIRDGRHPVVEKFVRDAYFVPNDAYLDTKDNRLALITGPNMAGKSTYMRQTALIVLLAQIGSFVPASYARVGIVDKLFTRVGASDDLASGQSTFMLEMREVAYILNHATKKSFIIYDEIGRGTSTYDGMSIARAVAEYTASAKLGAKTMFATHYHELTSLEDEIPGFVNYNIAAKKRGDDIIFLRKIVKGPTDDSYGIEVAKLAGVPSEITKRAKRILSDLESDGKPVTFAKKNGVKESDEPELAIPMTDSLTEELKRKIAECDLNTITPIEAMNLIFEWKKLVD
ncbi:MAG: DNA mismatch repair protein MutS [Clostridia bacterium]|nr:DNA mismatch repair protein MutS [Clostridia bacterium]